MKRTISIFVMFAIVLTAWAASEEKQYKKLIQNFDVCDEAKAVEGPNPAVFIKTFLDNNELLWKFAKDIEKKKGAEKEALNKVGQLPRFYPQYDNSCLLYTSPSPRD